MVHSRTAQSTSTDASAIERRLEGVLGGFRYVINSACGPQARPNREDLVSQRVIIWRCENDSLEYDAGAMIVRTGDKLEETGHREWHAAAFQAYDLPEDDSPMVRLPWQRAYWKLAVHPPKAMTVDYNALIPEDILSRLERSVSTSGE
jgi:hypothetical protein